MSSYDAWLTAEVARRRELGLTRQLHVRTPGEDIDLAGNDYLGLSRHPAVVEAAVQAVRTFGAGAGASRLVTGTLPLHEKLESELATFVGAPSGLAFSTGYHANLSVLSALVDDDVLVVSDAHVHASMIDGCRLARARVEVAPHNDVSRIEEILRKRRAARALVLAESIYSVLGDAAPVAQLVDVCERTDALLVVDEAHAIGVAGAHGEGLFAAAGLSAHPNVLLTGTLSKSLGAQGGVALGGGAVRDQIINRARPFIYDTGLAPAPAGAALAALEVIRSEPARVTRVNEVARALADACGVRPPAGAVLAVPMPSPQTAVAAVEQALSEGVRIGCFRPPSTPDGISRLRLTAHADLGDEALAYASGVLGSVVARFGAAAA